MNRTLLTRNELAARLKCHPNTIDVMVKDGSIRPRRLTARKYLYIWEEIVRDFGL